MRCGTPRRSIMWRREEDKEKASERADSGAFSIIWNSGLIIYKCNPIYILTYAYDFPISAQHMSHKWATCTVRKRKSNR